MTKLKLTIISSFISAVEFEEEDRFIRKVARNPKEIQEFMDAGFEYVCKKDGLLFFRKRK